MFSFLFPLFNKSCILANSDDREHTVSNATLPTWVPKIGNGWKGEKGVAG